MATLYLNSGEQDILNKADYLLKAAKSLGITNVKMLNVTNPEYVLNIQPYYNCFVCGSTWTGVWEIDCLINTIRMRTHWPASNTVFLANTWKGMPKGSKFIFFPQACEPDFYRGWTREIKHDFVFIGTTSDWFYHRDFGLPCPSPKCDIYKERARCIEILKKEFDFVTLGKRTEKFNDYLPTMAQGRIQFIRSMQVKKDAEVAQRFFECLPIGPVLTNYAPDLDNIGLKDGEDFLYYSSDAEMVSLAQTLLDDNSLREKIAKSGREKAFQYHTYEHRLATIITFLQNNYDFKSTL